MLTSLVSLQQGNVKKIQKIDENNIEEEGLHIFWTTWANFNEIFMKDVAPDNIKSYEKAGFLPLFSLSPLSLSLENTFLKKPQVGGGRVKLNIG